MNAFCLIAHTHIVEFFSPTQSRPKKKNRCIPIIYMILPQKELNFFSLLNAHTHMACLKSAEFLQFFFCSSSTIFTRDKPNHRRHTHIVFVTENLIFYHRYIFFLISHIYFSHRGNIFSITNNEYNFLFFRSSGWNWRTHRWDTIQRGRSTHQLHIERGRDDGQLGHGKGGRMDGREWIQCGGRKVCANSSENWHRTKSHVCGDNNHGRTVHYCDQRTIGRHAIGGQWSISWLL